MDNLENNNNIDTETIINPWLQIWIKPRKTIRHIVNTNPEQHIAVLAVLNSIFQLLDQASTKNLGDKIPSIYIIIGCIILGSFFGNLILDINTELARWTGRWFGGLATSDEIRATIAWGSVPYIVSSVILWPLQLLLCNNEIFKSSTPTIDSNPVLNILFITSLFIGFAIGLYSVIIELKCLSEVQQFSIWKALASRFLAVLILLIPIALIIFLM